MEVFMASTFPSFRGQPHSTSVFQKHSVRTPQFTPVLPAQKSNFRTAIAISPTAPSVEVEQETKSQTKEDKFDWYENWYPVAAVCDLDKRRPHGKKVIGIDVVVWWDRNENAWKVFDDSCPHRLAPLSEGRIDQWGRLQCVYHGWCFGGAGEGKFIPQAPRHGPPVHTSSKACAGVYPSCLQNGIIWFWPNSDQQYKDIHLKKKPHHIPEHDDPSYTNAVITRDIAYGYYEVLIENLMDPSHVPYAHYGIIRIPKAPETVQADREGGGPIELTIDKISASGYNVKQSAGGSYFIAPCLYHGYFTPGGRRQSMNKKPSDGAKDVMLHPDPSKKKVMFVFYCIPVSPGQSRLIFVSRRNFAVWIDRIMPRWIFHIGQNLVLDSDLYLLHVEERRLKEVGPMNWHKSCYVPTKADANVVAFRRWLNKYGGAQVDWRNKYTGTLPPTPPREQLMDRYWSHTVNCSSCSVAYQRLNALDLALQVISIGSVAIVAAAKQGAISIAARYSLLSMAVLCFVASKWLSHFIYKTFRYHDYDHAFR
uniref:PTC52-like protein 1 n=1 Tax=Ocimum basilicum TaxID=39350 RepID=A0A076FGF7_OCIBA|nr:PTC52-like protein 1 [Ocimum basilicum]